MSEKIFDEFNVDCLDCREYWADTCDGVPKGEIRPCTSFRATRSVDIPEQIKALKNEIKGLKKQMVGFLVTSIIFALHLLAHLVLGG